MMESIFELLSPDSFGRFILVTSTKNADGDRTNIHRREIVPGHWSEDGKWKETDLTNEPPDVQKHAKSAWTSAAIKAYQAAMPFVEVQITSAQVKAECRRRILLVMTEDQQRNTLAAGQAAVMQHGADPAMWPPALQARQAKAMSDWIEIERLRTRSGDIEKMDTIPGNIADDYHWAD